MILPPLSSELHPDEEKDAASEGTDGLLWESDGIEYQREECTNTNHSQYAERSGVDFHECYFISFLAPLRIALPILRSRVCTIIFFAAVRWWASPCG